MLELGTERRVPRRLGKAPVPEACDQRARAREQVAEVVPELALVALVEVIDGGVPVLAEPRHARDVEAERVDAVQIHELERLDHVAARLRDLAIAEQEPAVDEDLFRHLVPGGEQQRRPEDAVEAEDVLADQVPRHRPKLVP